MEMTHGISHYFAQQELILDSSSNFFLRFLTRRVI